jgi:hypothetical protein
VKDHGIGGFCGEQQWEQGQKARYFHGGNLMKNWMNEEVFCAAPFNFGSKMTFRPFHSVKSALYCPR